MPRKTRTSGTVVFEPKAYLDHLMGLVALLSWAHRWDGQSSHIAFKGPWIHAALLPSQRFALGFPNPAVSARYGRLPFLATQKDEALFVRRLHWAGAWADPQNSRLLLTTQKVLGDAEHLEDLPALGISLSVDVPQKLEWLLKKPRLAARSLWFDEDGHHVAGGLPMAEMPLKPFVSMEEVFPAGALSQERSLKDLIQERLDRTNRDYLPYNGQQFAIPNEFKELVDPFQAERVEAVRPRD